jgi:hypothetical protein
MLVPRRKLAVPDELLVLHSCAFTLLDTPSSGAMVEKNWVRDSLIVAARHSNFFPAMAALQPGKKILCIRAARRLRQHSLIAVHVYFRDNLNAAPPAQGTCDPRIWLRRETSGPPRSGCLTRRKSEHLSMAPTNVLL